MTDRLTVGVRVCVLNEVNTGINWVDTLPGQPTSDVIVAAATSPWRLVLSGMLESGGQTLRAFSLEIAPAWLSGVAGSLGPVVVVGAGVLLFGERLGRSQVAGIVLIGIGLVLLALA